MICTQVRCAAARAVAALVLSGGLVHAAVAGGLGINFQNDNFGFGPYSVSTGGPWSTPAYGTAFGLPGGDWFDTGVDPSNPGAAFNPASGGAVNIAWQSSAPDGTGWEYTWAAYGWAHANQGPGFTNGDGFAGAPQSGEEVVLAGFAYGLSTAGNDPFDRPITVVISGLSSLGPGYRVKLIASSEWYTNQFTPAVVDDGLVNESVDLTAGILPDHPEWNLGGGYSTGAVADALTVFTGDTLTITLTGPNEFGTFTGDATGTYGRTTLAGIAITAVPEPASAALAAVAGCLVGGMTIRRRRARR